MMTNLFSVFDPTSSFFNMKLNWTSSLLFLFIFIVSYWNTPSRISIMFYNLFGTLSMEMKTHLKSKISTVMFLSIMVFIMIYNLMELTSYTFTSTAHMLLTLTMALPLWISFMLFGWFNKCNHMFAHLVSQGTPSYLMPFMVLIETINNIIRPITLSNRLAANMITGHLLLTLLGNQGPNLQMLILILLISSQILLLLLETAVAIIQSYAFTILSVLLLQSSNLWQTTPSMS